MESQQERFRRPISARAESASNPVLDGSGIPMTWMPEMEWRVPPLRLGALMVTSPLRPETRSELVSSRLGLFPQRSLVPVVLAVVVPLASVIVISPKVSPAVSVENYGQFTVTDANGTTTAGTTGIKQLWGTSPNLDDTNSARVSGLSGDLAMNFPVRVGPIRHSVSGIQIIESDDAPEGPPVLSITPTAGQPGAFDFSWSTSENRAYDLVSSDDLTTTPETWLVWDGRENISGTGETITLTGVPSEDPQRFFALIERAP